MAAKRVLIVDDEENIGRSLRMILEREGYAVNVCRTVAEFGRHPDVQRADAFLFDMKLPDGNGIDLLKAIRQNGPPPPDADIADVHTRAVVHHPEGARGTPTGTHQVGKPLKARQSVWLAS